MQLRPLTLAAFVIATGLLPASGQGPSNAPKRYAIYLLEEEKTQWILLRVKANLYFMHLTPRPPKFDDRKVLERIDYWCKHFEVNRKDPTYIKAVECGPLAAGWLQTDESEPPAITIEPDIAKASKWVVESADAQQDVYIGVATQEGKTLWLSLGEPTRVDVAPSGKSVYEFRPAVLSATKKFKFRFSKVEKS